MEIGLVDAEITGLQGIIKNKEIKKKLTSAKHIAHQASIYWAG